MMKTKLLIVDDSALMRQQLKQFCEKAGDFEIQVAKNGLEAIEKNLSFQPHVISLDINMPEMDGLTALSHIMVTRPVPVVMVSSLTEEGAFVTFEALALGAVDYVTKPSGTISLSMKEVEEKLIEKLRVAARAKVRSKPRMPVEKKPTRVAFIRRSIAAKTVEGIVVIGVSTGGPSTLEEILPNLPPDFPLPIIVAQHMPSSFTGPFANRLNSICSLEVIEGNRLLPLMLGTIYICKGGADAVVTNRSGRLMFLPKPESSNYLWHPSVELLGRSILENCDPRKVIAVMLTGMGYDGADAFTAIKKNGGLTIAESEDSAIVFGMPKELIDRKGASIALPASKIADQLAQWARTIAHA